MNRIKDPKFWLIPVFYYDCTGSSDFIFKKKKKKASFALRVQDVRTDISWSISCSCSVFKHRTIRTIVPTKLGLAQAISHKNFLLKNLNRSIQNISDAQQCLMTAVRSIEPEVQTPLVFKSLQIGTFHFQMVLHLNCGKSDANQFSFPAHEEHFVEYPNL